MPVVCLGDRIFPPDRHPDLVQTEWAGGWYANFVGFGDAAEFLTSKRREFGAGIDQSGGAIFFLQRHRVELGLKLVLHSLGDAVPKTHSLCKLWRNCELAVTKKSSELWSAFSADQAGFVLGVCDVADQAGMTFRYPTDLDGRDFQRPAFIDLAVLQEHAERFETAVEGLIDTLVPAND